MKKLLSIELEKCAECAHLSEGDIGEMNWCCLANEPVADIESIPEFCPLPTVVVTGGSE